jgi:hypothetical protein
MFMTFRLHILLLATVISCQSSRNYEGGNNEQEASLTMANDASTALNFKEAEVPFASDPSLHSSFSRKIIKEGRMEILVKDLESGKQLVDGLVKKHQGYFANETMNNQEFQHGYTLTLRIPAKTFDTFLSQLKSGDLEVAFISVTSQDVTEEFIDLETRLRNKKNYINRYADLLKKAKSVKDILEIEEKTRIIEEEVESTQGRLKYLNHQVMYSTLNLQISKKNDFNRYSNHKGKFLDRLKLSLVKGWFGMVTFVLFIIRIWPVWILAGAVYYGIKKIRKRR